MSPGISGDAGGLTLSSLSSSLWLSKCGERGSRGADMSGGTLKRSENLAWQDELWSWQPVNFLMLQSMGSTDVTRYWLRPRELFLSDWRYTRSPTTMGGCGCFCASGALDCSLYGWFLSCVGCWVLPKELSLKAIWALVNWSLWVHIFREESPRERIREFETAIATDKASVVTVPPNGCWQRSSASSSCTACHLGILLVAGLSSFSAK